MYSAPVSLSLPATSRCYQAVSLSRPQPFSSSRRPRPVQPCRSFQQALASDPLFWAPTTLFAGIAIGATVARAWLLQHNKLEPASPATAQLQETSSSEPELLVSPSQQGPAIQGLSTPKVAGDEPLRTEIGAAAELRIEDGVAVVYTGLMKLAPGGRHYATYSEYDGQKFFYPSAFSDWKYAGPMVPQSDMEALFEMAHESCMYEDDFWEAEGGMD